MSAMRAQPARSAAMVAAHERQDVEEIALTTALTTQRDIHDAERRLATSIRRREHSDLVAPPKRTRQTSR